jgi:putative membrane protein
MTILATLPHHVGHFGGPFHGGFGFLFLLIPLFWIGVVVLIVRLSTRRWRRAGWGGPGFGGPGFGGPRFGGPGFGGAGWGGHQASGGAAAAETTLAERFAQGDIDEKEYRARLEVLRANAYPSPAASPTQK